MAFNRTCNKTQGKRRFLMAQDGGMLVCLCLAAVSTVLITQEDKGRSSYLGFSILLKAFNTFYFSLLFVSFLC